ncbi:hypothetical protein [Mycobacteroides abscessus]|nr:hypothetical protein [Mycobacteroides abscessus]SKG48719.1 Uncharacterised protein [Mycobacteroides abscessus subsp. massiliense]SKH53451.1 Uncharacterised protein [Mycobacteroides abscessus subsp. massiliense]SKH96209.1 Uncharacterised protein [Mycobacteroides abscessus subsp. massiliense]SKI92247.1 Uncharacterised protein [Mycobacteroides abscessus subsp. massiliense]SKJ46390.1 Uncharacterised protein [Mycobacteroides abscessus subsp. massiliense]
MREPNTFHIRSGLAAAISLGALMFPATATAASLPGQAAAISQTTAR